MAEQEKQNNGNSRKKRKGCLGKIIAAILLLIVIVAFMMFSPVRHYPRPEMNINDTLTPAVVGFNIYSNIKNSSSPEETAEITLLPQQINSILKVARNSYFAYYSVNLKQQSKMPPPDSFDAQYLPGEFNAAFCWNSGVRWIFGGAVDIHAKFNLSANEQIQENIEFKKITAGWMPIPAAIVNKIMPYVLNEIRQIPEFAAFRQAIKSIQTMPDGSLKIVYYPYKLKEYQELFK